MQQRLGQVESHALEDSCDLRWFAVRHELTQPIGVSVAEDAGWDESLRERDDLLAHLGDRLGVIFVACLENAADPASEIVLLQERVWSSPIWYVPAES